MLLFDTPICYFQAPFLLLLSIFWWVYVNQSSNDLIFNDGCFISGLLVVSLNFRSSGLFMKILALLTICVFCLWLISLRCHSFKMLQHKEGQLYNQMMAWKQAPWASAVKCTFKDQIAIKRKETGGKKNSSASGTCETITKYLTSVSLESPAFDQQETEPAEAGESTRPFLEVSLQLSFLWSCRQLGTYPFITTLPPSLPHSHLPLHCFRELAIPMNTLAQKMWFYFLANPFLFIFLESSYFCFSSGYIFWIFFPLL